jgi:hypothetical protein
VRERAGWLPALALIVLAVGLAAHNLVMSLLWQAGARGGALDVLAAWKDALLAVALVAAVVALRRRPTIVWADRLALLYAGIVVVWALLPQGWLGDGTATTRGEILALRHHLLPVGAYALGRLAPLAADGWRRTGLAVLAVGGMLAAWGLFDVYAVPLDTWRDSGVPGWFSDQLGLRPDCLTLPENWILNTNDEANPLRRLTSTFLSPLATAYALVIVLLLLAARRRVDRVTVVMGAVAGAGLLWTHTRAAFLVLAVALVVLAALQRRPLLVGVAVVWVLLSIGLVKAFPTIGPSTSYTAAELACLRDNAAEEGQASGDPLSGGDASTESHLRLLKDGIRTVLHHPQGFGLGNAGVTASRTGAEIKAGESTYTEIGVDAGLAGALALIAWLLATLVAVSRRSAWLAACVVAFAAIGLQTDVIGVHWLSVVVFALAGAAIGRGREEPPPEDLVG